MTSPTTSNDAEVQALRREVCALHQELVRWGLVAWTSGNVSARVPGTQLMLIKPSGVSYDALTPETLVLTDLHGTPQQDGATPSSDTGAHGYVYRAMPDVGGIVHTHSPYATAWAARSEPIPCAVTAIADEFGAEIPVGPFAMIGNDEIGRGIVDTLSGHPSPAVLMAQHGPFTIGPTPRAAVKAAVMCEDAARTIHLARQQGQVEPLPPEHIAALHHRYQNVYGQRTEHSDPTEGRNQ
ncbi:L-ribulose-5-phosphate 4-epimerase [Lipingzhangella sp. LS1_29]|uniref:L-ribulose-5-phosphate 4-epimerase n=1 Tax=Lipingzhangella rawalii TaxID=2055835 RepID=A0ABU2H303_9ACTN|nr:L-ribulose-5-phosphate 4-epimerase [Lipingzhangella rawalii]MDS1269676.1 L-ribulose-5-phosphate 4-epimerase [Lipingzhangella rawalii]